MFIKKYMGRMTKRNDRLMDLASRFCCKFNLVYANNAIFSDNLK